MKRVTKALSKALATVVILCLAVTGCGKKIDKNPETALPKMDFDTSVLETQIEQAERLYAEVSKELSRLESELPSDGSIPYTEEEKEEDTAEQGMQATEEKPGEQAEEKSGKTEVAKEEKAEEKATEEKKEVGKERQDKVETKETEIKVENKEEAKTEDKEEVTESKEADKEIEKQIIESRKMQDKALLVEEVTLELQEVRNRLDTVKQEVERKTYTEEMQVKASEELVRDEIIPKLKKMMEKLVGGHQVNIEVYNNTGKIIDKMMLQGSEENLVVGGLGDGAKMTLPVNKGGEVVIKVQLRDMSTEQEVKITDEVVSLVLVDGKLAAQPKEI